MKKPIVVLAGLLSTVVWAQIPHQFQSGTPARAGEVNENFAALDDRANYLQEQVDANETAVVNLENALAGASTELTLVDSLNQTIGRVVDFHTDEPSVFVRFKIAGSNGEHIFIYEFYRNQIVTEDRGIYFASADCSGTPYIGWSPEVFPSLESPSSLDESSGDIYVPSGPADDLFSPGSIGNREFCSDVSGTYIDPATIWFPAVSEINLYALHPPPFDVVER